AVLKIVRLLISAKCFFRKTMGLLLLKIIATSFKSPPKRWIKSSATVYKNEFIKDNFFKQSLIDLEIHKINSLLLLKSSFRSIGIYSFQFDLYVYFPSSR